MTDRRRDSLPVPPPLDATRWRRLVEHLDDGLLVLDRDGHITYANRAAGVLLGREASALVGAPFGVPIHGADETDLELPDPQGGASRLVRLRIVDAEWPGEDAWMVTLRDRSVELALARQESLVRAVFAHSELPMAIVGLDGTVAQVNRAFARWMGYPEPRALAGVPIDALTHPDDRAATRNARERLHAVPDEHLRLEKRYLHQDGHSLDARAFLSLLRNADGAPQAYVVVAEDVRAERAAKAEAARARGLVEAAVRIAELGTWRADLTTGRLEWSDRTMAIFGVEPDSFPGTMAAFLALVHPDDLGRVIGTHARATTGHDSTHMSYRIIRPSGEERIVVERGEVVSREADGTPTVMIGVVVDDTHRRRSAQRAQQVQRLESIGTLTGGIAHHLNNMLAPVMMSIGLLKDDPTAPDVNDTLDVIETSARRAAHLVQQLLIFARGNTGEHAMVDLRDIARQVRGRLQPLVPDEIRIDVELPDAPCWTRGDAVQLEHALYALAQNAVDAVSGSGRVRIIASTNGRDLGDDVDGLTTEQGTVAVTVLDDGPGIPPSLRQQVLDPFYSTKLPSVSAGLGLPTAFAIAQGHRGALLVADAPGRGASVSLVLPRYEAEQSSTDGDPVPAADGATTTPTAPAPAPAVLVVDDEETVRRVIQMFLGRAGIAVLSAGSGSTALRYLSDPTAPVGLLISDMRMPGMDGVALVRAARAISPALPVIVMSGADEHDTRAELGDVEVQRILAKPFSATDLVELVRELLPTDEG